MIAGLHNTIVHPRLLFVCIKGIQDGKHAVSVAVRVRAGDMHPVYLLTLALAAKQGTADSSKAKGQNRNTDTRAPTD